MADPVCGVFNCFASLRLLGETAEELRLRHVHVSVPMDDALLGDVDERLEERLAVLGF